MANTDLTPLRGELRFRRFCGLWLSLFLVIGGGAAAQPSTVPTGPAPEWVLPVERPDHAVVPADVSGGIWYLLLDRQVRVNENAHEYYVRMAMMVADRSGTEDAGQITLSYDPAYQQLTLHELKVIRGNQSLDRLEAARIEVMRREEDLDNNILDGELSVNIVVADVRVGDIVEYAYSRVEDPSIHDGTFSYGFSSEFSVPLARLSVRIDWPAGRDLSVKHHETDIELTNTVEGGRRTMVWRGDNLEPIADEDEVPDWYDRYGWVQLTSFADWSAVSQWMTPYYRLDAPPDPEVLRIADEIKVRATSRPDQIMRALKYAQHEIRYTGIALGVRSFVPHAPDETVSRGYGDCKDKTLLLIKVLRALGFDAVPALVDLDEGTGVSRLLPNPWAFDHVITLVRYNGKDYWLDATDSYQADSLESLVQPDLGYALPLVGGSAELVRMPVATVDEPSRQTLERFEFVDGWAGDAVLTVETVFRGADAETMRATMAGKSIDELKSDYLNYYAQTYPTIQEEKDLKLEDDPEANEFRVRESYRIVRGEQTESIFEALTLDAYSINSIYDAPDTVKRSSPFATKSPVHRVHVVEVAAPDIVFESMDSVDLDGKAFTFQLASDLIEGGLRLTHSIKSVTDHVAADDVAAFIADVDVLDDKTYHKYWEIIADDQGGDSSDESDRIGTLVIALVVLIAIAMAILGANFGYRDGAHRDPETAYYPVPTWKFILLSVVTFRIYHIYWFSKHWLWVRAQDQSKIMPIWRAIFYPFWAPALVNDMNRRFPDSAPARAWGWIILVLEIVLGVASNIIDADLWAFWVIAVVPIFLWLPVVRGIQRAAGHEDAVLKDNNRLGVISIVWTTIFGLFALVLLIALLAGLE